MKSNVAAYGSILGLLRCPATYASLRQDDDHLVSNNEASVRYRIVDGVPILVDFSKSIIPETPKYESPVRGRRSSSVLKRMINGRSSVTARNCSLFLSRIREAEQSPTVLVIGGGTVGDGAEKLYENASLRLISFDIYLSDNISVLADAHSIPMSDKSVDGVWIQAVLEHVAMPEVVVNEIWRVLKKGGIVYSETPFMQMVHEGAYDFTRFSELGHRFLFRRFDAVGSGSVAGPATVVRWAIRYAIAALFRSRAAGTIAWVMFFWLRFLDSLMPASFASDGASCVYFLGRKSETTRLARDLIQEYHGAQQSSGQ